MRHPDWKLRLIQYVGDSARTPFELGVHDCALFAAGAVLAMTGVDLASDWRGKYQTLEGGLAALQAAGYADHIALAAAYFEEIEVSFAAVGDLAVLEGIEGQSLGIVQGSGVYVLTPDRMGVLPLTAATRAFRVA